MGSRVELGGLTLRLTTSMIVKSPTPPESCLYLDMIKLRLDYR